MEMVAKSINKLQVKDEERGVKDRALWNSKEVKSDFFRSKSN